MSCLVSIIAKKRGDEFLPLSFESNLHSKLEPSVRTRKGLQTLLNCRNLLHKCDSNYNCNTKTRQEMDPIGCHLDSEIFLVLPFGSIRIDVQRGRKQLRLTLVTEGFRPDLHFTNDTKEQENRLPVSLFMSAPTPLLTQFLGSYCTFQPRSEKMIAVGPN